MVFKDIYYNEDSVLALLCAVFSCFSRVQYLVTPWTVAPQAPLPWDFPGKNTEVACHVLLQGIFLTQGSNLSLPCLLHCRQILYLLNHWCNLPYVEGDVEIEARLSIIHCNWTSLVAPWIGIQSKRYPKSIRYRFSPWSGKIPHALGQVTTVRIPHFTTESSPGSP